MKMAAESLAPMGALLCIMGGGGAFKQVIVDSGVGAVAGRLLVTSSVSPLLVGVRDRDGAAGGDGLGHGRHYQRGRHVAPIVKGHSRLQPGDHRAGRCAAAARVHRTSTTPVSGW